MDLHYNISPVDSVSLPSFPVVSAAPALPPGNESYVFLLIFLAHCCNISTSPASSQGIPTLQNPFPGVSGKSVCYLWALAVSYLLGKSICLLSSF